MSSTNSQRDTAAECHTRAAADRMRADGMDTRNGRLKFEESAANWEVRGALLGRLEASFDKRERLDAAALRFAADQGAEAADAGTAPRVHQGGATATPAGPAERVEGGSR